MRVGAWTLEINFSTGRAPLPKRGAAVTRQRDILGYGSAAWWSRSAQSERSGAGQNPPTERKKPAAVRTAQICKRGRAPIYT